MDPWALTSPQDWERAREARAERELALEIGRRNTDAIRSCTLLAALLEGQEVDAGTAAEVGYAAAVGLTCFGLRSDLRRHGEDGMAVNLQLEAFIAQSGGRIVRRLGDLVEVLRAAADASA